MSDKLNTLFSRNSTPTSDDYFDDDGNLLVNIVMKPNTYNFEYGFKYDYYLQSKTDSRKRKSPYIKFVGKRTYYRISGSLKTDDGKVDEPKTISKISFIIDPNSNDAKLLLKFHLACKSCLINAAIKKNKKAHKIMKYKQLVQNYIKQNHIKITDKINYGSFCDRVPQDLLPECKSCCNGISELAEMMADGTDQKFIDQLKKDQEKWILNKINIPFLKKKNSDGTYIYDPNPTIRTQGNFGVEFCNYTLKGNYIRAKKRLERCKKQHPTKNHKHTQLNDILEEERLVYESDRNEPWYFQTLNKKIPPTTLCQYIGVRLETAFIGNSLWVDLQFVARHVWYTNDTESLSAPDCEDEYQLDDEDDISDDDDMND